MPRRQKINIKRYAFVALIISALACVATGGIGLLIGLVKMQLFSVADLTKWQTAAWISLAVLVIGIAVFGIIDPDRVRRFLTGRRARYGSNSLILLIAVIGIVFAVNMLAFQHPDVWGFPYDFTEDKSHTLAPETIQALKTLPQKVNAIAFFSQRSDSTPAAELLQNFKVNSSGKFDYQFMDPDTNPVAARQAGVTGDGKIMLVMGDKKEIASYADETELTRALIRLISPEARTIYFLTGHGEADVENASDTSMTVAKSTLEGKNYTVKALNLLAQNKIPEDAQAIVIAGPVKPISQQEVNLLKSYLDNGGGLILMQDPTPLTDFGDSPDPLAGYLSSTWGIELQDDIIVDLTSSNELFAVTSTVAKTHPITQSMTLAAIFPQARSIALGKAPENVETTALVQTSDNSWGETDFATLASGQGAQKDDRVDIPGPLTMAAAAENTQTNGRVVVFGDSPFARDQNFDAYGNGDIFVNSVDWAAQQENLIEITPRQPIDRTLNPISQVQWLMILLGSVLVIPGLVVLAGFSNWLTRRRLG